MTKHATWLNAGLALAIALTAAGCGGAALAPGLSAKAPTGLAARAGGWEEPEVLETFDDLYAFDFSGPPSGHPFYLPLNFSKVKVGGSAVMEILAPNCPKMTKGFALRAMDDGEGSFMYTVGDGDDAVERRAARAKVAFSWANNTTPSSTTALSAMALFVFQSKALGTSAIAYAWSNTLAPGRVVASQLRLSQDESVPLRILVIEKGNGLGEQCSETALSKMKPSRVERDIVADVRYAFAKSTPLADPTVQVTDDNGPKTFDPPAGGPNTDLDGLLAIGFGAEVPKGICSHAVIDDVAIQIKKTD